MSAAFSGKVTPAKVVLEPAVWPTRSVGRLVGRHGPAGDGGTLLRCWTRSRWEAVVVVVPVAVALVM